MYILDKVSKKFHIGHEIWWEVNNLLPTIMYQLLV